MEGCLLCLELNKELLDCIQINSSQWKELQIRKLIEKHLWAMNNIGSYSWICKECWQELNNFHQFYQRIEEAHATFGYLLRQETENQLVDYDAVKIPDEYDKPETCYLEPDILLDQPIEEKIFIKEESQEEPDIDDMTINQKRKRLKKDFIIKNELLNEDPLKKTKKPKAIKPKTRKTRKSTENFSTAEQIDVSDIKEDPELLDNLEPSIALESLRIHNDEGDEHDSDTDSNYEPDQEDTAKGRERNNKLPKKSYYKPLTNRKEQDKLITETFKEILCELCQFPMCNFSEVHKHFGETHNQRGYVRCCNRKFFNRTCLVDHIDYHKNPDQFKCKLCGKELTDSICLKHHLISLHGEGGEIVKTYSCDICGKTFPKPFKLRNHKLTHMAKEEKKFPCAECGKFYASTSNLNMHRQAVHLRKFVKICHVCGKSINSSTEYRAHMEKHEGKKPVANISCDICGLRLTSQRGLKLHKEAQHPEGGKKDHCCPVCPKISPTERALKKHILTMHEKCQEHKCTICEKSFKRSEALKEHMASHTGTTLYTCQWCPKTFNSNGNMHAHRKKMHPREWEETQLEKYSGNLPPQYLSSMTTNDSNNY